jgi:hypothetical protein
MMAIEKEQRQKDFTGEVTIWCGLENVRSMEGDKLHWISMGWTAMGFLFASLRPVLRGNIGFPHFKEWRLID